MRFLRVPLLAKIIPSSHQEAFDQLRKRSFFRKFSDQVLIDYVSNGFIEQADCVRLRIPK